MNSIFLIIPAFNEEESIQQVIDDIPDVVNEVIVVDNGSTDQTSALAVKAGATVLFEHRKGYGYACTKGIDYAVESGADILVFMDGDGSDHAAELGTLVDPILRHNADLVIGSRLLGKMDPGSMTFPQKFGNKLAAFLMKLLYGGKFTDLGPFRAIKSKCLLDMRMQEMTYGWTVEMQVKALKSKLDYREVPVSYRPRQGGKSKVSGTVRGTVLAGFIIIKTILKASWS